VLRARGGGPVRGSRRARRGTSSPSSRLRIEVQERLDERRGKRGSVLRVNKLPTKKRIGRRSSGSRTRGYRGHVRGRPGAPGGARGRRAVSFGMSRDARARPRDAPGIPSGRARDASGDGRRIV
jgi:hypothetical protein